MEIKEQDLFAEVPEEANAIPGTSQIESPIESAQAVPEAITENAIEETVSTEAIESVAPEIVPEVAQPVTETKVVEEEKQKAEEKEEPKVEIKEQPKAEKKPKRENIIWQLFITFFKIGIVTFGGGYAMIPMIESEVVDKKKWVEKDTFLDLIAIAQTCPGVFAINISTFIGYKLRRNFGACMAAFGAALPSFIIILLIATMFTQIQDVPWVAACFRGIRPAVVALIAVPTFNLAKSAKIGLANCWIPIFSALLIYLLGVNPVIIIIAAALGGYLYGSLLKQN